MADEGFLCDSNGTSNKTAQRTKDDAYTYDKSLKFLQSNYKISIYLRS